MSAVIYIDILAYHWVYQMECMTDCTDLDQLLSLIIFVNAIIHYVNVWYMLYLKWVWYTLVDRDTTKHEGVCVVYVLYIFTFNDDSNFFAFQ